ncbi:MAG: aminotransferase class IV [Actinomycetota bacterium]|nr:aminotransferase class IV [Actinomycetota bacterium]
MDHGLVTGDGVFEAVEIRDGRTFALGRHLARMCRSAAGLGLTSPPVERVREAVGALLEAEPVDHGVLRITWTGGPGPLGSGRVQGKPTLVVAAAPVPLPPPTEEVWVVPWCRNEKGALTGLKTTSYAENVRSLAYARERGAGEALLANTVGHLCEGTGSNVFVVAKGDVLTPPLSSGCLAGITRELLREVFPAVLDCDMPLSALTEADEVFLTSTGRHVQAVAKVDGQVLPNAPGPVTRAAADAFARLRSVTDEP